MTTVYGYTTSSPDTQPTLSLEEAPFWQYLEILRKEGFAEDADASELFYVELLTTIPRPDGSPYTRDQIMKTSFQNLLKASELIVQQINAEIKTGLQMPSTSGPVMAGAGADGLNEDQLQYLMRRQIQLHEEEKMRLAL